MSSIRMPKLIVLAALLLVVIGAVSLLSREEVYGPPLTEQKGTFVSRRGAEERIEFSTPFSGRAIVTLSGSPDVQHHTIVLESDAKGFVWRNVSLEGVTFEGVMEWTARLER